MSSEQPEDDPLQMLDALQPFLENLRGMVASFVADGFTVEQARELTVSVMRYASNGGKS